MPLHALQKGSDGFEGRIDGERENDSIIYLPDPSQNIEDVFAKDFMERFLANLPERDRQIVQLCQDGYTYVKGYGNHGGDIKRIEVVEKKYRDYQSKA